MTMNALPMPVLGHRWRIQFNKCLGHDNLPTISRSATKCDVDYKNKTVKLVLIQDIVGDLHLDVYRLCDRKDITFQIEAVSGNDEIYHATQFIHGEIIEHDLAYDYASSDTVKHKITLSFKDFELMVPVKEEE